MDEIEVGSVYMYEWPAECLLRTANASMPFSSRSLFDMETFVAEFASNADYNTKLTNCQRSLDHDNDMQQYRCSVAICTYKTILPTSILNALLNGYKAILLRTVQHSP